MHIGAQPVPQSLIKKWKSIFPNHLYDTNYGLSESIGPGCVHLGVENIHKVGAIGKAGYGWEVKIVDENRVEVAKGEVGELAVKGPTVMLGYYGNEEATKEAIIDGWFHTGDLACKDENGNYRITGRLKDMIIRGGENIYPKEIEEFIYTCDKVSDVQVIGVPDKTYGEEIMACIILKKGEKIGQGIIKQYLTTEDDAATGDRLGGFGSTSK